MKLEFYVKENPITSKRVFEFLVTVWYEVETFI